MSEVEAGAKELPYGEAAARLEEILGRIEEGKVDIDELVRALSPRPRGLRRALPREDPRRGGPGEDDHRAARARRSAADDEAADDGGSTENIRY